ncbi:MFS superfamily [Crucibulum laeve]|uniref:MFS superfamily n=1 Tax=Crucibulum laeve TaxID=68775 RepID=A0A5C3M2D5_9AGAR|nr:MFS superfamily [Crucibulum laeve]
MSGGPFFRHTTVQQTSDDIFTKDWGFLPIPKRLQYDPIKPPHFGTTLNIAFGIAGTFTVANLYYCQPLLIQLAASFVSPHRYATGLLVITPLGDLVRRRQLILIIMTLSASLTVGLAVTNSLIVFEALSFLVGVVTVTPQVLLPLAADLAPPERRGTAISVVLSGLLFGILIARVLAGIIAEFRSWRVVYYFAIAAQYLVILGCYFLIPDYPSKNKGMTYWQILGTMAKFSVTEPLLIQTCLINMASMACFSNFWVTLTFLLGEAPYNYSTLVIGLFGVVGMAGVATGPFLGRIVDIFVPWYASLLSIILLSAFQAIQVAAGGIHIAAVVISTFGLDIFRQMLQVSLSTAVFSIQPDATARLNAISVLSVFIGQVMGTSVGTKVFINYGWRAGAALSMGWYGWQLFILLVRGPHCHRFTWFGYEGVAESGPRSSDEESQASNDSNPEYHQRRNIPSTLKEKTRIPPERK